jgi:hypothetical protein
MDTGTSGKPSGSRFMGAPLCCGILLLVVLANLERMGKAAGAADAQTDEQRVLHCLAGTMALDAKQKRLVGIEGRLLREVKFLGGLAGYLHAGGTFSVKSENVAHGDWELKALGVEMTGKALLFKSISV